MIISRVYTLITTNNEQIGEPIVDRGAESNNESVSTINP